MQTRLNCSNDKIVKLSQTVKFQSNCTNYTICNVCGSSSHGQTILNALTGEKCINSLIASTAQTSQSIFNGSTVK